MRSLNRVVMATDFSSISETAAAFALTLTTEPHTEVHLITVEATGAAKASTEASVLLDRMADGVRAHHQELNEGTDGADRELDVQAHVITGDEPAEAILSYAETHAADLVVTGTRGRRGVSRAVLGSVATAVVRAAPCPVLTVRDTGALSTSVDHLLVPVDFSEPSSAAVAYAGALAEKIGARLTVVYVMEKQNDNTGYGFKPSVFGTAEAYKRARKDLAALTADLPVAAETKVLDGKPAEAIAAFAMAEDVDCVVMSTRGHSGMKRLLAGSVTEAVMTSAPCPVLVARDFTHDGVADESSSVDAVAR